MKILISFNILLFTALLSIESTAQDSLSVSQNKLENKSIDEKTKTLFSFSGKGNSIKKIKYIGFSINPETQFSQLAGAYTPMAGFAGLLHFNKTWAFGIAGYGTVNNFTPSALSKANTRSLDVAYGGLKIEYTPAVNSVVHLSFPLLIGGGASSIDSAAINSNRGFGKGNNGRGGGNDNKGNNRFGNGFGFVQPGINLEANVFRFVKVYGGVSYRIIKLNSTNNTPTANPFGTATASQLSGLNFNLGAKVGLFDYQFKPRSKQKRGFLWNRKPRNSKMD